MSDKPPKKARTVLVRLGVVGSTRQFGCSAMQVEPTQDDVVVVTGDRGDAVGVVLLPAEDNPRAPTLPQVLRRLTGDVLRRHDERQVEALARCRRIASTVGALPVVRPEPGRGRPPTGASDIHTDVSANIVAAELSPDRKRATFFFTSPQRVDFRKLVRALAKSFQRRIELRQIGVRDAARRTGGRGVCGRQLCCSSWLPTFQPVSLRLAKQQGLALSSDKLSGACGRLRCCLRYEQEHYQRRPADRG